MNGQLLIDDWNGHPAKTNVGTTISLVAGTKYSVRMEYYQAINAAMAKFQWAYPGQATQIVPTSRLFSTTVTTTTPSTPQNLTAAGVWSTSCCGGQAMAHIELAWSAGATAGAPAAVKYNVYRNGALLQAGVTATSYIDMGVPSGTTNTYQVTAVAATSKESLKSAPASATAPYPSVGSVGFGAPTNLRIKGLWQTSVGLPTDVLSWDPTPGAVSYNVYLYDGLIAKGLKTNTYTVPVSLFVSGLTYAVTAVDASGTETFPSAIVTAQGAWSPIQQPPWMTSTPNVPFSVVAKGEWNAGIPRIRLTWSNNMVSNTYNIYRDGKLFATGIWGQVWFDNTVKANETHIYAVSAVNIPWVTVLESKLSASATAIAPSAAPAKLSTKVTITKLTANDDSVLVAFNAVPGAVDYRVYNPANPGSVKYSGGGLSIEMNGLDPTSTTTKLVVEAVDKLGPFEKMDGMMGPGAAMPGMTMSLVNGQGDPSNVPNIIAASDPVAVTFSPRSLTGSQVFFDNFRNEKPLAPAVVPAALLARNDGEVVAAANDKWTIYNVAGDLKNSKAFFMGNHFMDTLYDGGTPGISLPLHNQNASMVIRPNPTADISGGKVLHVTFEVDAHFGDRRWCNVFIAGADDTLLNPGKFFGSGSGDSLPTVSGNMFRWEIFSGIHDAQIFQGWKSAGVLNCTELFDEANGVGKDSFGPAARILNGNPVLNGTTQDLDKRHRFDLYISQNRFVVQENGVVLKNAIFPNNVKLPFTKCAVYFVHELYHTGNDNPELIQYHPEEKYWINYRPWADERHWDNMGFEVLTAFPFPAP